MKKKKKEGNLLRRGSSKGWGRVRRINWLYMIRIHILIYEIVKEIINKKKTGLYTKAYIQLFLVESLLTAKN